MYLPDGKWFGLKGKQGSVDRTGLFWLASFQAVKGGSERLFCWVLDFYLWEMGWEGWLSKYWISAEELRRDGKYRETGKDGSL